MEIRTPDELEQHLAALSTALTAPGPDECVLCFVERMLAAFGCDGRPAERPPCAGVGPRPSRPCVDGHSWRQGRW